MLLEKQGSWNQELRLLCKGGTRQEPRAGAVLCLFSGEGERRELIVVWAWNTPCPTPTEVASNLTVSIQKLVTQFLEDTALIFQVRQYLGHLNWAFPSLGLYSLLHYFDQHVAMKEHKDTKPRVAQA